MARAQRREPSRARRVPCPVCGRVVAVRKRGQIREHLPDPVALYICQGSGRTPEPIEQLDLIQAIRDREFEASGV